MPGACKKDNFPTQYKNDHSLFCDLGVLDAEYESMFLQIEKNQTPKNLLSSHSREKQELVPPV